jgi:putative membrane protein
MKKMLLLAAAAALAATPAALAQSPNTTQEVPTTASQPMIEVDTATFIKMVASSNAFEMESSKLAKQNASSDAVKKFAQQMITDHTKAGEDFKAALENVNTTSSVSKTTLQLKEQQALDKLKAASGEAFDSEYVNAQVKAHDEALALFRSYSNSGDDLALKEFAKKTLPVLEMHQQHVKGLQW